MAKSILVIDDDELLNEMLQKMLASAGYSVTTAHNGVVGIKMYREKPSDLVITDLIMPEKEGIETIRELKQEFPDVKIIAISGGGSLDPQDYLLMAERFGAVRTIAKPFRKNEILEAVKEVI